MQEKEKAISKSPGASVETKEAPRVKREIINKRWHRSRVQQVNRGWEILHKTQDMYLTG